MTSIKSFLWTGTTSAILRADGKTPEVNDILEISTSWQEISFLCNFNILVGMLLGPTDLVESSEDSIRATLCLSVGLKKKNVELYFSESLKSVYEYI